MLLIFLHFIGILQPIESGIFIILKPAQRFFYNTATKITVTYNNITTNRDLIQENNALREQLNQQLIQNSQLLALEEENQALRELLEFYTEKAVVQQTTNVISRGKGEKTTILTIDKGAKHGLKKGQAVIAPPGILMGKLDNVTSQTSKVILLTDSLSKVPASISGEQKSKGIVEGESGLSLIMNFIPLNEKINIDEIVVTSDLDPQTPPGLIIGRVKNIQEDKNQPFKSCLIEPLVDYNNISIVSVILQ